MRNYIRVFLLAAFAFQLHAFTVRKLSPKREDTCPSMFVAVLTTPAGGLRRSLIRKMWKDAGDGYGEVLAKFALCTGNTVSDELLAEQNEHNDLLLMTDCEEGYLNGTLTKKVEAAMNAYLNDYSYYDLFMKVDDDTFVSTRRFCSLLMWRRDNQKDNMNAYFGVFAEGTHEAIYGEHFPIRDPDSPWFEPVEKFNGQVYPVSAKGGPGYALSRRLVQPIIQQGIAMNNELNNEDKAVGVWVDKLVQQGIKVDIVNVPGTDGYDEHADSYIKSGPYQTYKATLHHHLTGQRIACLHEVDHAAEPTKPIDHCFNSEAEVMYSTVGSPPAPDSASDQYNAAAEIVAEAAEDTDKELLPAEDFESGTTEEVAEPEDVAPDDNTIATGNDAGEELVDNYEVDPDEMLDGLELLKDLDEVECARIQPCPVDMDEESFTDDRGCLVVRCTPQER